MRDIADIAESHGRFGIGGLGRCRGHEEQGESYRHDTQNATRHRFVSSHSPLAVGPVGRTKINSVGSRPPSLSSAYLGGRLPAPVWQSLLPRLPRRETITLRNPT